MTSKDGTVAYTMLVFKTSYSYNRYLKKLETTATEFCDFNNNEDINTIRVHWITVNSHWKHKFP